MIGLLQTKTISTKPTTSWSVPEIRRNDHSSDLKSSVKKTCQSASTEQRPAGASTKMQQRQLQHGLKRVFINYFTQACVIVWESYNLAVLQEWPELISSKQNWSSRRPATCLVPFIEITLKNWQKTFSSGEQSLKKQKSQHTSAMELLEMGFPQPFLNIPQAHKKTPRTKLVGGLNPFEKY